MSSNLLRTAGLFRREQWAFDYLLVQRAMFLWGWLLIHLLLVTGLYFNIRTVLLQFRRFGHLWRSVLSSRGGISSFQAFCVGFGPRVGTGNIAGVAIALTLGGPGAIFWMSCVALLGTATAFVEATLAQVPKVTLPDGTFRGSPAFGYSWPAMPPDLLAASPNRGRWLPLEAKLN